MCLLERVPRVQGCAIVSSPIAMARLDMCVRICEIDVDIYIFFIYLFIYFYWSASGTLFPCGDDADDEGRVVVLGNGARAQPCREMLNHGIKGYPWVNISVSISAEISQELCT